MTAPSIVELFNAIDCVELTLKKEQLDRELLVGIEGASVSNNIDPDANEPTGTALLLQNPKLLELQRSDPEFASQLSAFIQDITGAIVEEITSAEDRQSALAEYVNLKQRNQELEKLLSNLKQHNLELEDRQSASAECVHLRQRNQELEKLLSNLKQHNLELEDRQSAFAECVNLRQRNQELEKLLSNLEQRNLEAEDRQSAFAECLNLRQRNQEFEKTLSSLKKQRNLELEELLKEPAHPTRDFHTGGTCEQAYRRDACGTQARNNAQPQGTMLAFETTCRILKQQLKEAVSRGVQKDSKIAHLESLLDEHVRWLETLDEERRNLQSDPEGGFQGMLPCEKRLRERLKEHLGELTRARERVHQADVFRDTCRILTNFASL